MSTGNLRIFVTTARDAQPLPAARIYVFQQGALLYSVASNGSGQTAPVSITAPEESLSYDQDYDGQPYASVDLLVLAANHLDTFVSGVQVFANRTAVLPISMTPLLLTVPDVTTVGSENAQTEVYEYGSDAAKNAREALDTVRRETAESVINDVVRVIAIPPHILNDDVEWSSAPDVVFPQRVLNIVAVPEYITVHLGTPTSSAENVTVKFTDYIKNVCCSEIYPTWPENAIRANIHCQVSLALNRIFTELYRSKGYSYDITNSTAYDQYFVKGRNIYDNISDIVDGIFNVYVQKSNYQEPFYAEYCNGTTATCPGLKQWGTVTLAQSGYTVLGILQYYYGSEISLKTADTVSGVPLSYPGTPLQVGSTGASVSAIQTQLLRIRQNFPLIPSPGTADGVFGSATRASVVGFQQIFDLTADGIVGFATWYKISYIYVAVTKLAELTSEGVTTPPVPGTLPNVTLSYGSSGEIVSLAQYLLLIAALFYEDIYPITVDGVFGSYTKEATIDFQELVGLTADGYIGMNTWAALYDTFYAAFDSISVENLPYPGTALSVGSVSNNVAVMQRKLNYIARYFPSIATLTIDGIFGYGTQASVKTFQGLFGLTVDGIIGEKTWDAIVNVFDLLSR